MGGLPTPPLLPQSYGELSELCCARFVRADYDDAPQGGPRQTLFTFPEVRNTASPVGAAYATTTPGEAPVTDTEGGSNTPHGIDRARAARVGRRSRGQRDAG